MQKLLIKTGVLMMLFAFLSTNIFSQPAFKAKERIQQLKKIKLLEILNLSEQQSDAFLIKYSSIEKKVEEKKSNLDIAVEDLESAVKRNAAKDEIKAKTQKVENSQKEFMTTMEDSRNSIKGILSEENYAKYLVFEHKFKEEVQKIIMKNMKNKKGNKAD
jgi:hypothetical protein